MSKSHITEVSQFCIEGKFINFVIKDGYKLKGLLLETADGECYVKLAKHLRTAFDWRLPPGTWLQVVGEKKQDLKTGEVKFKAQRVMAARGDAQREEDAVTFRRGDAETFSSFPAATNPHGVGTPSSPCPSVPVSSSSNAKSKKATILVCQKSDCMKRGGKQVCQALEAALSARGLESEVTIKGTGCMKNCKAGPNLVMPDKTRYSRIQATQVPTLMDKHFAADGVDNEQPKESEVTVPISS